MLNPSKAFAGRGAALRRTVFAALMLCAIAGLSPAAERTPEEAFLLGLIGVWAGRAVVTPMGPLPYDIVLARVDGGAVAGTANPGAALHHWRFFIAEGQLRLRFLSTFRGNERPMWLYAERLSAAAATLRGRDLDHLTVRVERRDRELVIDIRLHDKAHVSIRLTADDLA